MYNLSDLSVFSAGYVLDGALAGGAHMNKVGSVADATWGCATWRHPRPLPLAAVDNGTGAECRARHDRSEEAILQLSK